MANFSEIPWIAEHIELYRTDPEKARLWDSTPLGGPVCCRRCCSRRRAASRASRARCP